MINGESYKIVVAEAAKNALGMENIYERVFIVEPLMDGDMTPAPFQHQGKKFYVFKAKAVLAAMGGAVHVFRPRSVGEGAGRSWYPPFNSGSSLFHDEGRRRDDLPGSPLHPGQVQGCLRSRRRVVPPLQVESDQRAG